MPEPEFVSDTTGHETVQSDLRPVIDELKQAITQALAERPRTHVNMVTDSGNQRHQIEAAVRHLDNTIHLLVPAVRRREPEALSQTGIETKPVIAINRLAPGTMEVDATTLLGHDKDMMDKIVDLDHGMSHPVLDKIMTRDMDRITNRLDRAVTIGPRSIMGHRHQETSAWSTTMEISYVTAHRRPLNGEMAHYQEMVHSGTNRDPSPYHQGWDDVNEVVGFVVRWDVIPGITYQQNRPQTNNNSSGNPLRHSNARVARRTTISGARGWARGPRHQLAQPFSEAHRDELR